MDAESHAPSDADWVRLMEKHVIMHQILEAGLACICVKDWEGRFVYVNQADADLYRVRAEELTGRTVESIVGREQFLHWLEEDRTVMRGRVPVHMTPYRRVDMSGREYWFDTVKIPLENHRGEFDRLLVIHRDVTSMKQAEQEREELQTQILRAQKMEATATLASGVAHNFNNLMMIVMGLADLMKHKLPGDHPCQTQLKKLTDVVGQASAMTHSLLGITRQGIEDSNFLDINHLVQQVQDLVRPGFPSNVSVSLELQENLPTISGHAHDVHQMLLNLLINAMDAMPQGGQITISTRRVASGKLSGLRMLQDTPEVVCIQVRDTGQGMTPEVMHRIFEPFYTTKGTRGTGLGLAFVYQVMRRMGGEVIVESQPTKGTLFSLVWPLS